MRNLGYLLQFILIRTAMLLLRVLPLRLRVEAMGTIGAFAVSRIGKFRKRAEDGLTRVYPDMPNKERHELIRETGRNVLRTLTELMYNREFGQQAKSFEVTGDGLSTLEKARQAGKGAIIISGHFGQWEAIRHVLKARDMQTGAVYRKNNNPFYEPLFVRNVEEGGLPLIPRGRAGSKEMLKHIRDGGFLALLSDQHFDGGADIPFLGVPATTTLSPAELSLRYEIPLVPAFATRKVGTIEVEIEPPIQQSDPVTMMTEFNDRISARIHAEPTQWHWLHKRWKGIAS